MTESFNGLLSDPSFKKIFPIDEETGDDNPPDRELLSEGFCEKIRQAAALPSEQKREALNAFQREYALEFFQLDTEVAAAAGMAQTVFEQTSKVLEFSSSLGPGLLGAPKDMDSPNQSPVDAMTRLAMRHPKKESLQLLYTLHQSLKQKFSTCSNEGLTWLLDVNAKTARGGFQGPAALRNFLDKDPQTISSSRLITGINSLLTAVAYRNIGAPKGTLPYDPETPEQEAVFRLLGEIEIVSDISDRYSDRHTFLDPNESFDFNKHIKVFQREDFSDVSDGEELNTPEQLSSCSFHRKDNELPTWLSIAYDGLIDVRLTQSGSVPLACAVAEWLLADLPQYSSPKNRLKTLELLAGTLFIPAYVRGDYHSTAETAAGIQHYLNETGIDPETGTISPYQAVILGVNWMVSAIDDSFKEPMALLGKSILSRALNFPYPPVAEESELSEEEDLPPPIDWDTPLS